MIIPPSPKTSLKILYGEAFRAPNASEIHLGGFANPDLEPEETREIALVVERYLGGSMRLIGNL